MARRFTLATLLGSALLFVVQPLVARTLLPLLGGVASLWNTCLVFFQLSLLAGYAYSHFLPKFISPRAFTSLHLSLLTLSLFTLPFSLDNQPPPPDTDPTLWVLRTLTLHIAPTFILLSSSAPLLQHWYVTATSRAPSLLISSSNIGSLTALLSYPFIIEPLSSLSTQRTIFTVFYYIYLFTFSLCALSLYRSSIKLQTPTTEKEPSPSSPKHCSFTPWLRHVALAFVPSSLLLGVTTHLSTDYGASPILWVLTLALYLSTFIVVFARTPAPPSSRTIAPFLSLLILVFLFTAPQLPTRLPLVIAHLALFTWCAYLLHGELARTRETSGSVTLFQLALALGGALGGVFNGLIAPKLFTRITEYPLALALCVLLLPTPPRRANPRDREEAFLRSIGLDPDTVLGPRPNVPHRPKVSPLDGLIPITIGALTALLFLTPITAPAPSLVRYGLPLIALVLFSINNRLRLSLGLIAILIAARADTTTVFSQRTFFGVLRVEDLHGIRRFMHGTTLHGLQSLSTKDHHTPLAYYSRNTPIAEALTALTPSLEHRSVGVVGLGVGMLIAYAHPTQHWTFYELDPAVAHIARTYFTWLRDSHSPWKIIIGDARRTLSQDTIARHGLLALDAFNSDSIPTHLLTREALELYLHRTDPQGIIAFHITNRHVDLTPLLSSLARETHLVALRGHNQIPGPDGPITTTWILLARHLSDLGPLSQNPRWHRIDTLPSPLSPWTDDRSDLLRVLRWR